MLSPRASMAFNACRQACLLLSARFAGPRRLGALAPRASAARRVLRGDDGQSTVEYALVCAAFVFIAIGLAALWHLFADGSVSQHALASASHHVGSGDGGAWGDVLSY